MRMLPRVGEHWGAVQYGCAKAAPRAARRVWFPAETPGRRSGWLSWSLKTRSTLGRSAIALLRLLARNLPVI